MRDRSQSYGQPPHLADVATIRRLSELNMGKSLLAACLEWVAIILAIAVSEAMQHPLLYAASIVIIGSRMYAFYSLTHDGMHYLMLRGKTANDLFTRLFLAWPVFLSLSRARTAHLNHHKYLKTPGDPEMAHLNYPEFHFPKKKTEFAWILARDLLGINFIIYFLKKRIRDVRSFLKKEHRLSFPSSPMWMVLKICYYVSAFLAVIYCGWVLEFIIYWLIPYMTVYQFLNRVRLSTEHFNIKEDNPFQTRSVKANFIEKMLISPHNLNYHIEHHLYPSVPFYRLPALRKLLLQNKFYRHSAHISNGYMEVLKDCVS